MYRENCPCLYIKNQWSSIYTYFSSNSYLISIVVEHCIRLPTQPGCSFLPTYARSGRAIFKIPFIEYVCVSQLCSVLLFRVSAVYLLIYFLSKIDSLTKLFTKQCRLGSRTQYYLRNSVVLVVERSVIMATKLFLSPDMLNQLVMH